MQARNVCHDVHRLLKYDRSFLPRRCISHASGIDSKHLAKGSICPKLESGKLRVYSMRFCPYAQRTLLVLSAKNILHEVVNINLAEKPDWFLEKNPLGKVPVIEKDGNIIYESLITADYLDEIYPEIALSSRNPIEKAKERMHVEHMNKVTALWHTMMSQKNSREEVQDIFSNFLARLDHFEKELVSRGAKYFGGEEPKMLDYMIWPWFERMPVLKFLFGDAAKLPPERFQALLSWCDAMQDTEAVRYTFLPVETHLEFLTSLFILKAPKYDMISN